MAALVIFEQHPEDHGPLARTRPVPELRCGALSLGDRLAAQYAPAPVYRQVRAHLAEVHGQVLAERGRADVVNALERALAGDVLLIDGAVLATRASHLPELEGPDELGVIRDLVTFARQGDGAAGPVYREGGRVVYLRLCRETAAGLAGKVGPDVRQVLEAARGASGMVERRLEDGEVQVMTYPWLLLRQNGAAIAEDYGTFRRHGSGAAQVDPTAAYLSRGRRIAPPGALPGEGVPVHLGAGSAVGAFVSFDVTGGPVIVDEGVTIESHCHLTGPVYVGPGSTLWAFADLKEGCSLGPRCRVCGQVEEAIFQGWTHKFHVGFIGHSYLGEGVNLGDQTVTSNLKNDRTSVLVHLSPDPARRIDTGSRYAGSLIGDGAATGTNTNLTTGAVVEPLSSIVSVAATPKYVSGFLYQGRFLPQAFDGAYGAYRVLVEERLGRRLPAGNEPLFRRVHDALRAGRRLLRRAGGSREP